MRFAPRIVVCAIGLVAAAWSAQPARAQAPPSDHPLSQAKALYASAAYEEALSLLAGLAFADGEATEAAQYRAFCLIALGRNDDAIRAIEAVVTEDPMFTPSATDLSPRVVVLFNDTRRKLLPGVLLRLYKEGRAAFEAKRHDRALQKFEQVLQLASDPAVEGASEVADLRVLASGFVDLSRAAIPPAPAPAAAAAPATESVAAASAPPRVIREPVAIRQDFPRWTPSGRNDRLREFEGLVRVVIGIDGTVKSAEIMEPIHPAYDDLLLAAAQRWTYAPAMDGGQPIEATKVITVRLFSPQ